MFAKVYYVALAMLAGLFYGITIYNKKRRDLGFGDIVAGVIFALTWPAILPIILVHAILKDGGFIEQKSER